MSITEEMDAKGLKNRAVLWRVALEAISKLGRDVPIYKAVAIAEIAIEEGQNQIARQNK